MSAQSFPLSDHVVLSGGSTILYLYTSSEAYYSNAASFIRSGLEWGQKAILIDSAGHYRAISAKLEKQLPLHNLIFMEQSERTFGPGDGHSQRTLDQLENIISPMLWNHWHIRVWWHRGIDERGPADVLHHNAEYENIPGADKPRTVCVCAYDANAITASRQNELLHNHDYMMSDTSIAMSPFSRTRSSLIPTPFRQEEIKSQMDSYKQKLDFIHAVSHEVRNPLTVIKAYAKMMLKSRQDVEDQEKLQAIADYVDVIDNEMTHIINTEQMLLTDSLWSRTETELEPIVREVTEMMSIKARTQNVRLHAHFDLAQARIDGSVIGLRLIVSNLLSNAIKYCEEGANVWLDARRTDGGWLMLRFRDEGCGMSDEQLAKLFRKYEKMNEEKSGQGIGLFVVKKLVDYYEGAIDVVSALNEGTEVTVRLREL